MSGLTLPSGVGFCGRSETAFVRDTLVCFGLKSRKEAVGLLEETFGRASHVRSRTRSIGLGATKEVGWCSRSGTARGPSGNKMKIVQWPQHPSRQPVHVVPGLATRLS